MLSTVRTPDHVPAWVVECTATADRDRAVWWRPVDADLEYPIADRGEVQRWMQRLASGEGGVLSADGVSRFAQAVVVGDRYVLELGAEEGLWQVSATRAEVAPRYHDARTLRRVDGRDVLTRVGAGWQLHLHSAADLAWRWVREGRVDAAHTLHPVH